MNIKVGKGLETISLIKESKETDYGTLDSSTFTDYGDYVSVLIKGNIDGTYNGSLKLKKDGKKAQIYTNHPNYRKKRVINKRLLRITIEPPNLPKDPEADQGFLKDDDWQEQEPINISQKGDYKAHLEKIQEYMNSAKNGDNKELILSKLLTIDSMI